MNEMTKREFVGVATAIAGVLCSPAAAAKQEVKERKKNMVWGMQEPNYGDSNRNYY